MKKYLLSAFYCFITAALFAQTPAKTITVQGTVIDSATKAPLGFVTIALTDAATKQPVKSTLTKDDGLFNLKGIPVNAYQLSLIYVGYQTKTIAIKGDEDLNAGQIALSPAKSQLKEVSILAAKPLMKQEVDRISYDVQADPESKAVSALDMMRKVPLLTVDASDNIQLKGSGDYKILINGKESALVAKNPADVLKAMPAINIEKIEVITTPPAKYDAEGLAGIINIITKKNADQGYNIGMNGRFNSVWGPGINLNGNVKQGKFGVAAYVGAGKQNNQTTSNGSNQLFFRDMSAITQAGTNNSGGSYNYANADISYEIDTLNLVTASINYFTNDFNQDRLQTSTTATSAAAVTQAYKLDNAGTGNYTGLDASLNYQLGFKRNKDQLLTGSYKYSYSPNEQNNDNAFLSRTNYPQSTFPDYRQYNNSGSKEHTVQLDYVHPLKTLRIEAGAKAIVRNNFSNYHQDNLDPATNTYITNSAQTNDFDYQQDVYSLYNSYQLKLDKWTGKAGMRLEHTGIDANFTSVGRAVKQDYNNFIPSVSMQRTLGTNSLTLGYTQRIRRPGIYQLNPFIDLSNPKFISTGNPNLRPEISNLFELNFSRFTKNSVNAGLSYAFSNNAIQNLSSLTVNHANGANDTVTLTTYQNLGRRKTLGLNINTTIVITPKMSLTVNGQVNHVWLAGQLNGIDYKNSGFTYNGFANTAYNFNKGYRFGIDAGFFSGGVTLQGHSNASLYSSYVLSKEFLNKTATISLVANNPYSKYREYRSTTTTADYTQSSFNQNNYRSLAIRFNYKFGRLNSEIKKNQRGINNDDTSGK